MLVRGKFGIEYTPKPEDERSSGLGIVFIVVVVVAVVAFAMAVHTRRVKSKEDEKLILEVVAPAGSAKPEPSAARPKEQPPPLPHAEPMTGNLAISKRPVKLQNLLMRLEEANRRHDSELAIAAIEQIRALPGNPAADLDDMLARRLGVLNVHRLFELRHPQWVEEIEVRRGDSASRIASEHGSTLASFAKLNGGSVERLVVGQKVYVLKHPRFNLIFHRSTRTADLQLNGKFFKRYDLAGPVTGKAGPYETSVPIRAFWAEVGVRFEQEDRAEIEMMLPKGTSVIVSDI